jgi:hypothetical protein
MDMDVLKDKHTPPVKPNNNIIILKIDLTKLWYKLVEKLNKKKR